MLKQWLLADGKVDSIVVEKKYVRYVEETRTDKWVTVSWKYKWWAHWWALLIIWFRPNIERHPAVLYIPVR